MKVLIQCGDHLENQKRIALLAKVLVENGQQPIILMYSPEKGSFIKSEGFPVVYLNKYLVKRVEKIDSLRETAMAVLKAEAARKPELLWPSKVKGSLIRSASYVNAVKKIIAELNPDHVCIWNGYTGFVANTLRVLVEKNSISHSFLERGLFKDSIFIDKCGVNGASSLSNNRSGDWRFKDYSEKLIALCNKVFPLSQPSENLFPKKKIVFFPLQVQMDTNIIYYSPYKSMREAFIHIYESFNADDVLFVVRPHPEEAPGTVLNLPLHDNILISSEESLSHWMSIADLVVTLNSTVGLEALLQGVPVVCIGESIYSGLNTISRLYDYAVKPVDFVELRNYLCFLLENNLVKSDSDFSVECVSKNIGFSIPKNKVLARADVISGALGEFLKDKRKLKVAFAFDVKKKIDVTYRNNNINIDISYIKGLLLDRIGDFLYEYFPGGDGNDADIFLVDDDWVKHKCPGVVIDYYGAFKYIDGYGFV